jgi:prevent-host-death family protein
MKTVADVEARRRLSEILTAVEHGEEYTITKRGAPIARIIPAREVDSASLAEAEELITRIKVSRKGSMLSEEEYREAVAEGRD